MKKLSKRKSVKKVSKRKLSNPNNWLKSMLKESINQWVHDDTIDETYYASNLEYELDLIFNRSKLSSDLINELYAKFSAREKLNSHLKQTLKLYKN